jgi:hypothetical protein
LKYLADLLEKEGAGNSGGSGNGAENGQGGGAAATPLPQVVAGVVGGVAGGAGPPGVRRTWRENGNCTSFVWRTLRIFWFYV